MKIALTGASGLVGREIAAAARAAGHEVTPLSRQPGPDGLPYDLTGPPPDLAGHDALIHCAFAHAPGKYRDGEGDDPAGFLAANRDGSLALFAAARAAGVPSAVFLSSRAVYDGQPTGVPLTEDLVLVPDSLYGRVKAEVEAWLAALTGPGFAGASLRATGVYGPGPGHKWETLFADFRAGRPIAPRVATEVHGADVAAAALLLIAQAATGAYNCSDLVLDRHDLLAELARLTGSQTRPPPRAEAAAVRAMDCARLAALGWRPGGMALLRATLPAML